MENRNIFNRQIRLLWLEMYRIVVSCYTLEKERKLHVYHFTDFRRKMENLFLVRYNTHDMLTLKGGGVTTAHSFTLGKFHVHDFFCYKESYKAIINGLLYI